MNQFRWITGLSAVILFTSLSTSAFALSPFKAEYAFQYNGKSLGSATRSLQMTGQNQWTYVFTANAGKMASASEKSQFSLKNNKIVSQKFERQSAILTFKNTSSIQFNPNNKTVQGRKDEKVYHYAWQNGALDELNAELQIRQDLKQLKPNQSFKTSYPIADAKEIEMRTFVKSTKTETIQTQAGSYETVKVTIQHKKPNRATTFWLAPSLDYLPVKVSHQDGNSSYGLLLKKHS